MYSIKYILAAFKYTDVAEDTTLPLSKTLLRGDRVGDGIVIINDSTPTDTQIVSMKHSFMWNGVDIGQTMSMGEIYVVDRNSVSLLDFLRNEVCNKLETSLDNITFSLRTFWVHNVVHGGVVPDGSDGIISSEHFYFSIPEIRHSTTGDMNIYKLSAIALYNTKCQLANYSDLYNFTVTHKDGNLHEEQPKATPSGGSIVPRGQEDAQKSGPRKERIDLSKPMLTLKDVMEAMEVDLKARNKIHKSQLQEWQSVIRDDFVDKVGRDIVQIKEIPIDYHIDIDGKLGAMKIDNRHLPFEQPEQGQPKPGIRAIPTRPGDRLSDLIDRVMFMSKEVAELAEMGTSYKIVTCWRRMHAGILKYNIRVHAFETPVNNPRGRDTGPGESAVSEPLNFEYKFNTNADVFELHGRTSFNEVVHVLEVNPDSEDGRVSFGSDRETITGEYDRDREYYGTAFSGPPAWVDESRSMGVEYPRHYAVLSLTKHKKMIEQDGLMKIKIAGNPHLFSDLLRKPTDVATGKEGNPIYYQYPEKFPMYATFKILNTTIGEGSAPSTPEKESGIPTIFSHGDTHMHIQRIDTEFSGGTFTQTLHLHRTEDII